MKILKQKVKSVWLLEPQGPLNGSTSPALLAEVENPLLQIKLVVINLQAVSYISSAGLRVLLQIEQLINTRKGSMLVARPQPQVLEIIKISKVDSLLKIEADQAKALEQLQTLAQSGKPS